MYPSILQIACPMKGHVMLEPIPGWMASRNNFINYNYKYVIYIIYNQRCKVLE